MTEGAFLTGERVSLRPVEREDLPFVRDGVNHPDVRGAVGQPMPSNLPTEERWYDEANRNHDVLQLLVCDEGIRVGMVELDPIDREDGTADLAFWIHPDHRERGYARDAIETLLDYTFTELRIHKVTANAFAPNQASRNLLGDLGFTEEGIGREDAYLDGRYVDTHYFGLLEGEWSERRDG